MSYIENVDSDNLLKIAADLRKRYNDARKDFYDSTRHYYHQSIASNYYTEDGLEEQLEKCRKLKEQYTTVKDLLHNRGIRVDVGAWQRNNDCMFTKA